MKKPAALILLLSMTACTSLQPVQEPTGFLAQKAPRFVVITTVDSTATPDPIVVARPLLDGSTLTGFSEGESVSYPMVSIRTVRAVQPDKRKTMFALVGGAVGVSVIAVLMNSIGNRIDKTPVCVPGGHRGDNPYCEGYDGIR